MKDKPQFTPKLTPDQIDMCLAHMLRVPELFLYARDILKPSDFNLGQVRYSLIWAAALAVARRNGGALPEVDAPRSIAVEMAAIAEIAVKAGSINTDSLKYADNLLAWIYEVSEPLNPSYYRALIQELIIEQTSIRNLSTLAEQTTKIGLPVDLPERLEQVAAEIREFKQNTKAPANVRDAWPSFQASLQQYRGREFLGLQTGLKQLDERTLGLRGLCLLGAAPNVGKTALVLHLGINLLRQNPEACFLFISLEMDRASLQSRIYCNLAQMDWSTLVRGDKGMRGGTGPFFTPEQQSLLQKADEWIGGNGHRIRIHDRQSFGNRISAASILREMNDLKTQCGAIRAFVVIDYLQVIPVPEKIRFSSEIDLDRYKLRIVQDILAGMKKDESALMGDAVLAISESRKPSVGRKHWGEDLSDLMGSARLGYGADAVLLYRRITDDEQIETIYGVQNGQETLEQLERDGIAPIMLELAKGRDGMRIGEWPMEYLYNRSIFREINRNQSGQFPAGRRTPRPQSPPPGAFAE